MLQADRVLVVTDTYFSRSGKAMEIGKRIPGAEVRVFDEVIPDPPASLAAKGAAVCCKFRPELLIALGGGSPMDCAKAIRLAAESPMLFVAIPTTSGSGSEVTSFSVLTHGDVKHALIDPTLRPDLAILDETLLEELPPMLIADTGMDLLAHCLEAMVSKNRNGFTDALAIHGVRTVLQDLASSVQGEKAVRLRLHEAATMAGMAFDNAGLGLCHAMAHVLGGELHLPHGRLCALLLPPVLKYNAAAALSRYAALAAACGLTGATEKLSLRNLISAVEQLRTRLRLPGTLKEAGCSLTVDHSMIKAVLADPCCGTNPVPVTETAVQTILKAVIA